MGIYQNLRDLWRSEDIKPILRNYMIKWRKEPVIVKLERPTRLDRARSLGYKAKKGFFIARIRVARGGRKREQFKGGRRSKHMRRRKMVGKSYQWIAEERANKRFHNCEVLNSYFLAKDGMYYWTEVILVDPEIVKNYKGFEWASEKKNRRRVFHGKTSQGRKSRGIRSHKGKGAEKLRPSLRAHSRKSK
ncbi:MAG: 50S ribosomal protein L15e [Candidatus Woesearchaeota archaeon]